jgi:hypothetical protein
MAVDPGARHQYYGVGNHHRLACIPEVISVGGETAPQLSTRRSIVAPISMIGFTSQYSITHRPGGEPRALPRHQVGHLRPMPRVFRDYSAPCICNTSDGRELALMPWGMPPPWKGQGAAAAIVR